MSGSVTKPNQASAYSRSYSFDSHEAWVLVPPRAAVVSSAPAAQFISQSLAPLVAKLAPGTVRRCVQRGGDVLVLPDRWAHLTYNLRASAGLAREFDLR